MQPELLKDENRNATLYRAYLFNQDDGCNDNSLVAWHSALDDRTRRTSGRVQREFVTSRARKYCTAASLGSGSRRAGQAATASGLDCPVRAPGGGAGAEVHNAIEAEPSPVREALMQPGMLPTGELTRPKAMDALIEQPDDRSNVSGR